MKPGLVLEKRARPLEARNADVHITHPELAPVLKIYLSRHGQGFSNICHRIPRAYSINAIAKFNVGFQCRRVGLNRL